MLVLVLVLVQVLLVVLVRVLVIVIVLDNDVDQTLSFDEQVLGWPSRFTYNPEQAFSIKSKFYTVKQGKIWQHNYEQAGVATRSKYYDVYSPSSITFVFNPSVSASKVFKTINYEGTNGWEVITVESDQTGKIANPAGAFENFTDTIAVIKSYNEGSYIEGGVTYRAGFDLKENRYVANVVNNTPAQVGEVIIGNQASGIKGYFTTVKIQTDNTTDPGGMKELFMVGSEFVPSSY